jgi:UDP-3-O-[3-hydroxymyristoyl] glucosamine N-acyltransferase
VTWSLGELAERVSGRVEGDPARRIAAVRALDAAGPGDLSMLSHPRYRRQAAASQAGALLVSERLRPEPRESGPWDLVVVTDPAAALATLLALLHPEPSFEAGVHPTAVLEPDAEVASTAHVGPYAVIGAGSRIGDRAVVGALVVVGRGSTVSAGAVLHPHSVLYPGTEIGPGSVVHAGAVVGSDGFGYVSERGVHRKVPQVGRVVVEADVEIGANTTIDRATLGETRIGAGSKIDNLVQVGHNVQVGRGCILCGQVGIAGSAKLGSYVVMAGQSGAAGHLDLGDGAQVAAKSAALTSVPAGEVVAGIPAIEVKKWRRQTAHLSRLETMARRVAALERHLGLASPEREAPGKTGEERS